MNQPAATRGRGRVRDPERHQATLDATVALLEEGGYESLTITAVARRAGVGRQLVYQWWDGDKALLVQEALFRRAADAPVHYPGPFATDLRLMVGELVTHFAQPAMRRGLPGLIADMSARATLRVVAYEQYVHPLLRRYERVVQAGIERGEVGPDTSSADLLDTLRGAVIFHLQARSDRPVAELVDHLVELVLRGVTPPPD